jgi:hypothetical protein
MTEFGRIESSDLGAFDAGGGRSDALMDIAMWMAIAVTASTVETVGVTIFDPMERNENRKQRTRSEALPAP